MLLRLECHIAECFERATAAEHRASIAVTSVHRQEYETVAKCWRSLARNFQESLNLSVADSASATENRSHAEATLP
jgi:hypothetical protein